MVQNKTQTYPGLKAGYHCSGKLTTNSSGEGNIVITTGVNLTNKILKVMLTPINSGIGNITVNVGTPMFDSLTKQVIIPVFANAIDSEQAANLSTLLTELQIAIQAIVSANPADTAALLLELSSLATVIGSMTATANISLNATPFLGELYFDVFFSDKDLPTDTNTQNLLTDNPS